ncbi:hypothetical protein [Massilia yuzhufengensis]|uniref:hypothetical protein n=1 Tax=Massilia yuzhufengensis TaxID=1164594 RepID=UPI0015A5E18E|nr:hypothetical protein [Massilia yuzhufengensis]
MPMPALPRLSIAVLAHHFRLPLAHLGRHCFHVLVKQLSALSLRRIAQPAVYRAHGADVQSLWLLHAGTRHVLDQLRQELAAAAATNAGLEARFEDLRRQFSDTQARAGQQNAAHLAEREKLAERTSLAEQRFADMERRALLEIDRGRTASAQIQKRFESEQEAAAAEANRLRTDYSAAQANIGQLREQLSSAKRNANAG